MSYVLIFFAALLTIPATISQNQGIEGSVYLIAGNQMPSPDKKPATPKASRATVRATICVYELTMGSQVTREGQKPYYSAIGTRKIAEVETDTQGHFTVPLPPGLYSVFAKKGARFYAYGSDSHNHLAPAEVTAGRITKVECRVEGDRPATY